MDNLSVSLSCARARAASIIYWDGMRDAWAAKPSRKLGRAPNRLRPTVPRLIHSCSHTYEADDSTSIYVQLRFLRQNAISALYGLWNSCAAY